MSDKKVTIVDGYTYTENDVTKDHAGNIVGPDPYDRGEFAYYDQQARDALARDSFADSKWRVRQNIINCYVSEQMSERQWIDHCNADPELLKMWEGQRDDLAKAEGRE